MSWMDREPGSDNIEVKVAELLVATSDAADGAIDHAVPEVLRLLRDKMKMDVVFVSEFTDGQRVFRHVAQDPHNPLLTEDTGGPLEESWCQRVVDGRLPEFIPDTQPLFAAGKLSVPPIPIGTHMSTPIILENGDVYGTLCCFSHQVNGGVNEDDMRKLRYSAQLTAQKIDRTRHQSEKMALEPKEEFGFRTTTFHASTKF